MDAIVKSLRENPKLSGILSGEYPVGLYGAAACTEPSIMEALRGNAPFSLVVTSDMARADRLYKAYRFLDKNVFVYPAKDALFFYADIHGNLISTKRLEIIKRIYKNEPTVIITTIDGLMDRLPDIKYFKRHAFTLKVGEELEMDEIKKKLVMLGYENMPVVENSGQFSVRGGIIDIFPLTEECPCRVEFFGDEIDSIRYFDVDSQRSIENAESVDIFPGSEYVLSENRIQRGIREIEEEEQKQLKLFEKDAEAHGRLESYIRHIKDQLTEYNSTSGLDSFVTYFFTDTVSFLDYLPENTAVFIDNAPEVEKRGYSYSEEFEQSMGERLRNGYILPGQLNILHDAEKIFSKIREMRTVKLSEFVAKSPSIPEKKTIEYYTRGLESYRGNSLQLVKDIKKWRDGDYSVLIVSGSETRAKRMVDSFMEEDVPAFFSSSKKRMLQPKEVMVTTGKLSEGFEFPDIKLVVLSETEIFGEEKTRKKRKKAKSADEQISSLNEVKAGDYVVHEKYGVGIYRGVEKITTYDKHELDYIHIDYAGTDKIFVPVDQMNMIGRYSMKDSRKPKLNKLGGPAWKRLKDRVEGELDEMVDELIDLYSVRHNMKGFTFSHDTDWQKEFEELFPYEETPDQKKAIMETKMDMESDKIMDRLICGDVGFGKTEVAIRAAFKAVQDGKQVAYLVPTTILAEQHYETFAERMKPFAVNVKKLSRFCTTKEIKETLAGLKSGEVDIVVGTHRILSKDVSFKTLGLLIIDEEQRFGVKHKETIKQWKQTVDVLTLTATPIPRTLHMSLIGVRDMSLLEDPPVDRRPIQTYVMEYDIEIVREAITRELMRQGQVYYVYNKVEDIDEVTEKLREALPDVRIEFAHGKMSSRELENKMHDFINRKIDVLVSTTIIETGLDIPNVNTIIIHNADRFGLAQLYQLRGRVGRSDRASYAFLMYQRDKVISEVAEKRLNAIRMFTALGSGYKISVEDLEIRGAGNLLGNKQSGHMDEIGYDLYMKMLNRAIKKKLGKNVEEEFETVLNVPVDAYIPAEYVRNEGLKLDLYKKISRIENMEDMDEVKAEAEDRFGEIPKQMLRLLRIACIRAEAHDAYIISIKCKGDVIEYLLKKDYNFNVDNIPSFVAAHKGKIKVINGENFGFSFRQEGDVQEDVLENIEMTIREIKDQLVAKKQPDAE